MNCSKKTLPLWIAAGLFWIPACDIEVTEPTSTDIDLCPDDPNKTHPGVCGCGIDDVLNAITGLYSCKINTVDFCPNDPKKTDPGICGCGVSDALDPKTGLPLCLAQSADFCPDDPNKTLPGICGCGVSDTIDLATGLPSCLNNQIDLCPNDPNKTLPGVCGCGVEDTPDSESGIPRCLLASLDFCPNDPDKTLPGLCGCGIPDVDSDGDTVVDCEDACPQDPDKTDPGTCGCGTPDSLENLADADRDGYANCVDACPTVAAKYQDDGCDCESMLYQPLNGTTTCARMIATAQNLVALRDDWNNGLYTPEEDLVFTLVADINLGDVLTQTQAETWVGIGTELHPFQATFNGNGHHISATRKSGYNEQRLTFGHPEVDTTALFGVTLDARIEHLSVNFIVQGRSHIAALASHCERTTLSAIRIDAQLTVSEHSGALCATLQDAIVEDIIVKGSVVATGDTVGGIAASAINTQFSRVDVSSGITGAQYVGGLVGQIASSQLTDIATSGPVTGHQYTAGIAGTLTNESRLLNAYTTSTVTCNDAPCAAVVAHIQDFVTLKTVYTTSSLLQNFNSGLSPIQEPDPTDPTEPTEPTEPTDIPSQTSAISVAMLIASIGSADNSSNNLFYWQDTDIPPLPDLTGMKGIATPIGFSYSRLRPYVDSTKYLLTELNNTLLCTGGQCTIDGYSCLSWTATTFSLPILNGSDATMTVTIPTLRIVF